MIQCGKTINDVKEKIKALNSKKVEVTLNLGRNKFVKFLATVDGVYPALFTVKPQGDFKGKTTFSYAEYLCGNVKLKDKENIS